MKYIINNQGNIIKSKKIYKKLIYSIILVSFFIIILTMNAFHVFSASFYSRFDPIESSLEYDLKEGDFFVYNQSQSMNIYFNLSIFDFETWRNGTYYNLERINVVNNTIFYEGSTRFCNLTIDQSIALLNISFKENNIIDMESDYEFKFRMSQQDAYIVQNLRYLMYINITSGNATGLKIPIQDVRIEDEFENELGNATIIFDPMEFYGNDYYGILIEDMFDILPYDNNDFPDSVYMAELDRYFQNVGRSETKVNETLQSILSIRFAFPMDLNITDLMQDGDGIFKTIMYFMSGSEEFVLGDIFDLEWEEIEEIGNVSSIIVYSPLNALYNFTYYDNGFNETADMNYNRTISFLINTTLTDRNILEKMAISMALEIDLVNRTTLESMAKAVVSIESKYELVFMDMHENEIPEPENEINIQIEIIIHIINITFLIVSLYYIWKKL